MHGIIYAELKKYVAARWSENTWQQLLNISGSEGNHYLIRETYPDEDLVALITAATEVTGLPAQDILRNFGVFIAPDLFQLYRAVIPDEWKTLDLLLNTEETIHKVVRMKSPGASPPALTCKRKSAHEVLITYDSPRKMRALAEGLIQGVADIYDEQVNIKQTSYLHDAMLNV